MHVRGSECFSGQVCDPVLELVMTRCDKAAPLAIKGVNIYFLVSTVNLKDQVK